MQTEAYESGWDEKVNSDVAFFNFYFTDDLNARLTTAGEHFIIFPGRFLIQPGQP